MGFYPMGQLMWKIFCKPQNIKVCHVLSLLLLLNGTDS